MANSRYKGRLSLSDKTHPQRIPSNSKTPLEWTTDAGDETIQPPWFKVIDVPQDQGPEDINLQGTLEVTDARYAPGVVTVYLQRIKYGATGPVPNQVVDYTAIEDLTWPKGRKTFRINYKTSEYGEASKRLRILIEHDAAPGADLTSTARAVKIDNAMQYAAGRMPPKDT